MNAPIVIVGAGQAGMKAAETLRAKGYDGDLVLFGDERRLPYQRPPLSKAYLKGSMAEEQLYLRPEAYFAAQAIDLRSGSRVDSLDVQARSVCLENGEKLAYSRLLLATGTRARQIPLPGADLNCVFTLRSMDDIAPLREALACARRIVIIGAGYVGMEFAAVAAGMDKSVQVVEAQSRVLMRSVAPEISEYFQTLHGRNGVGFHLGINVVALEGSSGSVTAVKLADGSALEADLVLVAVGAVPVTGLAEAAGLEVSSGIVVDEDCRTSAPDIFAAGDCSLYPSKRYGRQLRLESVQNAIDQAKAAACAMLGESVVYDPVPWFWSDQFDTKLQIAGLSEGYDRTRLDGDPDSGSFSLSYFSGDRLLAVDAINAPRQHMLARRELAQLPEAAAA
ncbi:FAD-dependent oxidoreductase [uncultured Roseibium sp.]|uniref:NAD(P)/FAD-dependent oxidoreductase n=1 Tax=uncultured Roseibium sp. TaxID=1936171 RepID=UPI00262F1A03|nr:FAD-dependent oxidoreductase [uncultured Roseibium sp.]